MALALYRTYRPGSLAEVIGQEHVTEPLTRALGAGRTHHAYLFSGPRGCGKTSTARIIARSLNCEQGPTAQPCGTCRSCIELAPNGPGSIDVVELDAATHRGIDDARELREKAIYAPAASRFKIYIIDEAHQLTNEAANALLKLVEEPPPHLRFIFATTEPDKIIPTIRSRTFHYGFRLVPARVLAEHLAEVCRAEGVPAEGPALALVARAGAGSVRDSLSVLGQLLAGAGPEGLTYADAVSALGLTDASLIDTFVGALAQGSAAEMFGVVEAVITAGHDPRRFVTDVLQRLRDLIILRADRGALASGLVDVPDDAGERMLAQAESLSLAELSRAADLVSDGLSEVKGATAPRLQLELLCARLALPSVGDDHSALLARLDRMERALSTGAVSAGAGAAGSPAPSAQAVPASPAPTAPSARPAAAPSGEASERAGTAAGPPQVGAPPAGAPPVGGSSPTGRAVPAPPRRPSLRSETPRTTPVPGGSVPSGPTAPSSPAPDTSAGQGQPASVPAGSPPAADSAEPAGAAAGGTADAPGGGTGAPAGQEPSRAEPQPAAPTPGDRASAGQDVGQAPVDASAGPGGGSSGGLAAVKAGWSDVLTRLAGDSRVAWTAFHSASPISLTGGVLAVAVAEPGHVRAIAQRGHDERLRQAMIDVLGLDVSIDVLHDPDAAGAGQAPAPGASGAAPAAAPASRGSVDAAGGPERNAGRPPATGPTAGAESGTPTGEGRSSGGRGRDLVRAAAAQAPAEAPDQVDEPSADDPDLDVSGSDGLALITRELGARPIGEIDHS